MTAESTSSYFQTERLVQQEQRVERIEQRVDTLVPAVEKISECLERLVRLEERHSETREAINRVTVDISKVQDMVTDIRLRLPDNLDKRLHQVEVTIPGLVEMRRWVVTGALSVLGLFGGSAIVILFHLPK